MTAKLHQTRFHENDLLYSEQFDDHFFSRHDGREECLHVFVAGNGLPDRWYGQPNFTIGELGFGTGLNFLATWHLWRKVRRPEQLLSFVSVDGFPLNRETAGKALGRWPELAELNDILLHHWLDLGSKIAIDPQTSLHVMHGLAADSILRFPLADAWYLDGFSPAKNPDMWSAELMHAVAGRTAPNGTCASYTAAGWVRRNLEDAGFAMEKRPGFGTKREMIAGVKR